MVNRVLVAMDSSEMATRALEYALDVYGGDAELTVLFVAGQPTPMMGRALGLALEDDIEEAAEDLAEAVFEPARDLAREHGVEIQTTVDVGNPGRVIVERAEDYDTVVVGSHGGSLQDRLFVGNVAEEVFQHSPVPVTIVR